MTGREPSPRWTPQSTTTLEEPPPWSSPRLARGSVPPPIADDADSTMPRVRLVALFEHDEPVSVSLDRPKRASTNREPVTAPWPRRERGAPWIWPAVVVAVMLLLGVLMLTR
jgi:hypothetical protein